MLSMNYGMQLSRIALMFSSLGLTFGALATSLVVFLYVYRNFRIRMASIVLVLVLFLSVLLNPSNSSWNFFALYTIVLGILIQSSSYSFVALKTAKLLFYLQSWMFVLGIAIFEYEAGLSGGGFKIVNDFTLQYSILGLYISVISRDFRYQCLCLIVSILNSAELLTIANAFIIFVHLKTYMKVLGSVAIIVTISVFNEQIFEMMNLIIYTIENGIAGLACGSRCFRVFALYHFGYLFLDFPQAIFGLGLGFTQDTLEGMKSYDAAIMAGSMHNFVFQLLFELGVVVFGFLIYVLRVHHLSLPLLVFITIALASTSNSVFSLGLVFLIIGQIIFFKRNH